MTSLSDENIRKENILNLFGELAQFPLSTEFEDYYRKPQTNEEQNDKSSPFQMHKKLKEIGKKIIADDSFYGFENFTRSLVDRIMLTTWWWAVIKQDWNNLMTFLGTINQWNVSANGEIQKPCIYCTLKKALDCMELKYGKQGKTINPVSFSIAEVITLIMRSQGCSDSTIFNYLFYATDLHVLDTCSCNIKYKITFAKISPNLPNEDRIIFYDKKELEQKNIKNYCNLIAKIDDTYFYEYKESKQDSREDSSDDKTIIKLDNSSSIEMDNKGKEKIDVKGKEKDLSLNQNGEKVGSSDVFKMTQSKYDKFDNFIKEKQTDKSEVYHSNNNYVTIDLRECVSKWLKDEEEMRVKLRKEEVTRALEVAMFKINMLIPSKDPNRFGNDVDILHRQIFIAAGDPKYLENEKKSLRLSKRASKRETGSDQIIVPIDPKMTSSQLTDLVFRETICLIAEQIQHCPARINYLYYLYRSKISDITEKEIRLLRSLQLQHNEPHDLPKKDLDNNDYINLFKRRLYTKPSLISTQEDNIFMKSVIETLKSEDIDIIKKGIREFKDSKLNFDDINDCAKWNREELNKTFREPFSMWLLLYIITKYIPEIITVKIWFIFLMYAYSTPDITYSSDSQSRIIKSFMITDVFLMCCFFVFSWGIRFYTTIFCRPPSWNYFNYIVCNRSCGSKDMWFFLLRHLFEILLFVGTLGYTMYAIFGEKADDPVSKMWTTFEDMWLYYVIARIIVIVVQLGLPMSAMTRTSNEDCFNYDRFKSDIKDISSRVVIRIIFMALFFVATGLFEYNLLVKQFDTLVLPFCGEREHQLTEIYNTQGAICTMSWVTMWVLIAAGLVIDNGLAFTVLMSLFGLILGIRRQGEPRALIRISKQELSDKIFKRFWRYKITDSVTTMKEIREKTSELYNEMWPWCVDYWRNLDLISNKEKEMLKSDFIDVSRLSSSPARECIGFWINALTIHPIKQMRWHLVRKTTILIPVYEEKLEFSWKDDNISYLSLLEARYLVAKYPFHWMNLQERIANTTCTPEEKIQYVTDWLSMHDQLVYRTLRGAASYFDALVFLAKMSLDKKISQEEIESMAMEKIEIILCYQTYQKNYNNSSAIIHKWLRKFPYLKVVYDFTRQKNMPPELSNPDNIPLCYNYATVCLTWDRNSNKLVYNVIPRENPLLLVNKSGDRLQGKAMNQLNGLMFLTGHYVQVLDANQGGHATEYLKFPALLRNFKESKVDGTPKRRIIGCREYVFTGPLSRVANYHAYQEWSFGTLVLRVYSDLGIRLHYGHPDVFHGAWARAHSGLSKVNPKINTSEDVFAGFEVMQCKERTKHLENIQFEKGRETGLANMSSFDSKISAGNAGLLRSRDLFHLTERLPLLKRFLFFYGISGHFLTNSMMVISIYWYIYTLFFFSLAGVSLQAIGGTIFATEWLIHAGFTTVIPLFAELLVERGPVLGFLEAIFFIPVSTIVYLFQMQTKHAALADSMVTGNAVHINTGRGLQIYRRPISTLFTYYSYTHFYPIFEILSLTFAYWLMASDLNGGSLPLIMIYFYCFCVLSAPQLFNPTLKGNSLTDVGNDIFQYVSWIGKQTSAFNIDYWEKNITAFKDQDIDFTRYCSLKDMKSLPSEKSEALIFAVSHFIFSFVFWGVISIFLLYPPIQYWLAFLLFCWFIYVFLYFVFWIVPFLRVFQVPASLLLMLSWIVGFFVMLLLYSADRVAPWPNIYIAFFIFFKVLQSFRSCILNILAFIAHRKYPTYIEEKIQDVTRRNAFIVFYVTIFNQVFLVSFLRGILAIIWGFYAALIAVIMRPFWADLFLFGRFTGQKPITVSLPNQEVKTLNFDDIERDYFLEPWKKLNAPKK